MKRLGGVFHFLLTVLVPAVLTQSNDAGYIRASTDGSEPFLQGWTCRRGLHFIEDPQYCDRTLVCSGTPSRGLAMYCPPGNVFDPTVKRCTGSAVQKSIDACHKRQVIALETPKKPNGHCVSNPERGESQPFYQNSGRHRQGYFKLALPEHKFAFFYCDGKNAKVSLLKQLN